MLRALEIRDMLIIDRLELELRPGLNVLTGETGAGKSILLDALGFVLGWRGRAELVRQGADQGDVVAVFDLTDGHPAHDILSEAGLPTGEELFLRRVNTKDGRKTAWVNDRRTSGDVLRSLSDVLVELHGQHDDRGLLNPRGHRALLDAFGDYSAQLDDVRAAWSNMSNTRRALAALEQTVEAARAEEDYLRHAVAELDKIDPQSGEDADLDAARRRMQNADRVRNDIDRAYQLLGVEAAEGSLNDAMRWLDGVSTDAQDDLIDPIAALSRALVELGEAQSGLEHVLSSLEFTPSDLEQAEERLFAIRGLARKHGVAADDLGAFAEELRGKLASLDAGGAQLEELKGQCSAAEARFQAAANHLTDARKKAAKVLDQAVMRELAPLKMDRAAFTTQIDTADAGPEGQDTVTFSVATNPGAPAGPLNKIASGGELSRFLLALKVCLTGPESGRTLIFDEIDRGVGGATADAVGRRLAALAQMGQVLVVTHSPQVAARGAHHWRVEKTVRKDQTLSNVAALEVDARIDEIARMLAGDTITEEARAAARALLNT